MGVFDKVKFWKREEPLGTSPDYDLGAPAYNPAADPTTPNSFGQGFGAPGADPYATMQSPAQQEAYPQQSYPSTGQYPGSAPFPGTAPPYPAPQQSYPDEGLRPRDVELILAKLDSIKSELDALHQRVRKIEQVYDTQQKRYW